MTRLALPDRAEIGKRF